MSVDAVSTQKKVLQERYDAIEADFISVNKQIPQTRDAADRNRLQRNSDDLFNQMTELEAQLKSSGINYNERYKKWEENLPEINFSQANRIFSNIFDKFFVEGGAAFFLLQNSRSMGGKWCVEKIKAHLKYKGGVWSPREVGFLSWEQPNQFEFIIRLGASFGIKVDSNNLEQSTKTIIDKIYESLQINSTIFIEIKIFSIDNQPIFLDWVINNFWISLISKLLEIRDDLPLVKFIAVMTVETPIPSDCLPPLILAEKEFQSQSFFEIELCNWTEIEIKNWLYKFSGLVDHGRQREEIERMARAFYQESQQGRPIDVYSLLTGELTRVFG